MTVERRYHSPYRHWVSGVLFEIALFACFLAFLAAVAFVVVRLAG